MNTTLILPQIFLFVWAIALLVLDFAKKEGSRRILAYFAMLGIVIAGIATIFIPDGMSFGGAYLSDAYNRLFNLIFLGAAFLTILASADFAEIRLNFKGEYYALILFSTVGMMVMASSADLITIFLGLEVMSIPLYVLAGIERERNRSREASLKYFLMGAFASGFLLYGIALLFGAYGTTNLLEIAKRLNFGANYSQVLSSAGLAFILIGLGFKAALAPFHMWVPDVYEGSIAPVTAFMSAGPKAAAFAALFRILSLFSPVMSDKFTTVLWVLAVITMTWGNILAISQKNIKRMLAYSSIAHAGYILVAFATRSETGVVAVDGDRLILADGPRRLAFLDLLIEKADARRVLVGVGAELLPVGLLLFAAAGSGCIAHLIDPERLPFSILSLVWQEMSSVFDPQKFLDHITRWRPGFRIGVKRQDIIVAGVAGFHQRLDPLVIRFRQPAQDHLRIRVGQAHRLGSLLQGFHVLLHRAIPPQAEVHFIIDLVRDHIRVIAQRQCQLVDEVVPVLVIGGRIVPVDAIAIRRPCPLRGVADVRPQLDAILLCERGELLQPGKIILAAGRFVIIPAEAAAHRVDLQLVHQGEVQRHIL